MLAVVIQPYAYNRMKSIDDIKSVAILKFSRKGILDEDFTYETVYDLPMSEIENKKELYDLLIKQMQKENVITYNAKLFKTNLCILAESLGEEIPDGVLNKVPCLMTRFGALHNHRRYAKIVDALQYYDHTLTVDTSDPYDMSAKTIVLYRLMQEAGDL